MAELNRRAAERLGRFRVHACTDVTGFGLLGHLAEMVSGSGLSVRLRASAVPVFPEALAFARMGLVPAGAHRNREFRETMVEFATGVSRDLQDVLFDPQTSGGLLISLPAEEAAPLCAEIREPGGTAEEIGEVTADPGERIRVE